MNLDLFDDPAEPDRDEEAGDGAAPSGSDREDEMGGGAAPEGADPDAVAAAPKSADPDAAAAEGGPGVRRTAGAEAGDRAPAADPDGPRIWTVSEVNRAVRSLLEDTIPDLWVGGEVGGWTRARSGHRYFTLKDEDAELDCVMWRNAAARLPADPEEGMTVRAYGGLTLYEARGRYQMVVRKLEAAGEEGLWRLAFEKLRKKLEEEGLLDPERKRPLPRFPERIGVVTSPTGAALRDILSVIRRRAPWTRVLVRGSRVQGEGAAGEIARAIRVLGESGRVDVLIVSRGGGSIEDLWAFNEEPVARAVAACPVPVISAVGHEVDVTISDLVADRRAPTPSAAGEAVVPDAEAILESLRHLPPRLARGLRAQVRGRKRSVERLGQRLERAMERLLGPRRQAVDERARRLERGMRGLVERRRQWLARAAGKVEALSPLSTMRRGYAVPLDPGGRVLRGVEDFEAGEAFVLRVVDGRVECRAGESTEEEVFGG